MADRNLNPRQWGTYFTEEGMQLLIPPSGFEVNGIPGKVDPFGESTTQQFPLGTKLVYADREFRYARMGGTVGVAGNLYQSVVPLAGHIDEAVNTFAAAATVIAFTPAVDATDDLAANELQDGYIYTNDDTGEGHLYRVKSHPAIAGAVSGNITLADPVVVAAVAATTCTVLHNPWRNVIIHPSPPTAPIVGAAVRAVTANSYCWLQVRGPCPILTDGTVVIGEDVVASDATDGAVEPADLALTEAAPPTGHGERHLGFVLAVNATTEYSLVWLNLEK